MAIPDFIVELRRHVGTAPLWLPAVTAVVLRDGEAAGVREILLVQRADNLEWTPVTGILDPGEQPAAGAVREVLEETGVHARVDRLALVLAGAETTHVNGDRAIYLDQTFTCRWVDGEAHVADDESVDVRWWPLDAMPSMKADYLSRIEAALADEVATRFARD